MAPSAARVGIVAVLAATLVGGCNAIFGVDDLAYDGMGSGAAGSGGDASSSTVATGGAPDGAGGQGAGASSAGGAGAAGGVGGVGPGAGGGGGQLPLSYTVLGYESTALSGDSVSVTVNRAVPSGTMLLAIVAGRGDGPVTLADSSNQSWVNQFSQLNDSNTALVGGFAADLVAPLPLNTVVTASTGQATDYRKALLVLAVTGDYTVLASETLAPTGLSIVLTAPVVAQRSDALVVGVVATGLGSPTSYDGGMGHATIASYATTLSSGAFFVITPSVGEAPLLDLSSNNDNAAHAAGILVVQ